MVYTCTEVPVVSVLNILTQANLTTEENHSPVTRLASTNTELRKKILDRTILNRAILDRAILGSAILGKAILNRAIFNIIFPPL